MSENEKKRIDQLLVELGLVKSRTLSSKLIGSGAVSYKGKKITVPSEKILVTESIASEITIVQSDLTKYVSRGGLKLEGAIKRLKLSVNDLEVLDIGISTGGFTDCLLQNGAKHITGVDVGHGQLHESLKGHKRVKAIEGVNAKNFDLEQSFDLAVIDVSFISLSQVLESAKKHVKAGGKILALVKPQFEVGPKNLNTKGVVKNESLYKEVEDKIRSRAKELSLKVSAYFKCDVIGGDGNQEFFILLEN
jgi:23S rRNA (cytidine1920-2'-O)/16S rRNA (cytidine1409-2'-O)-methyltransferase